MVLKIDFNSEEAIYIQLRNQIGKTRGGKMAASACTALLLFASLLFKIGIPLCLLERKRR